MDRLCVRRITRLWVLMGLLSWHCASADPTGANDSGAGVFNESLASSGSPDAVTGALHYAYQFELPPARGPWQPTLSLAYNSTVTDGEGGFGWHLDLPVIERRPLSGWPTYDDTKDRFAYNGRPLVFICAVGSSGCPTDEAFPQYLQPGEFGSFKYFRLQVEGSFERFFFSPDGRAWLVQKKGGEVYLFGAFRGRGNDPLQNNPDSVETDATGKQVFRWHFTAAADLHGNLVEYAWRAMGKRGLSYLTDIYDTNTLSSDARGNAPLVPDDFAHHTHLSWEPSNLRVTNYAHIDHAADDLRLASVSVASATWAGSGPREGVRVYRLNYYRNRVGAGYDPGTDAPLWGHSFLRSVQMEGRCGVKEDHGQLPDAHCAALPAVTFQYEPGPVPGMPTAALSHVTGAPPDADVDHKILTDVDTAAIVDVNGDGLPDVVQSWPLDAFINFGDSPELRGQVAYLNTGNETVRIDFAHQCLDSQQLEPANFDKHASLLNPAFGTSILGAWADSALIWLGPFEPHLLGAVKLAHAAASFCPAAGGSSPDPNHPAWRWDPNGQIGWMNAPIPLGGGGLTPMRWLADIDGDGLPDMFVGRAPGTEIERGVEPATVFYSRRVFDAFNPRRHAQLLPFQVNTEATPSSLAPSPTVAKGIRYFYADINGDGLMDLIMIDPQSESSGPLIRLGDGRGKFECVNAKQPEGCAPDPVSGRSTVMRLDVPDPQKPWPFVSDTYFHDVTGDGLADLVELELGDGTGRVRLWINEDGKHFRCANPAGDCVTGFFIDDLHGTRRIQPARVGFADMHGSGLDDIVVLAGEGIYAFPLYLNFPGRLAPRAPRPGLLTTIRNGYGALTQIEYKTIQELDVEASRSGHPWQHHSPEVASVVTRIVTRNEPESWPGPIPDAYRFERQMEYAYSEPAYDFWERRFLGFRRVAAHNSGESGTVTETTFWFGPCQENLTRVENGANTGIRACPDSSEDEDDKARVGRPVRIERRRDTSDGTGWLSITTLAYQQLDLFPRLDQQHVRIAYASDVNTYLYDPLKPSTAVAPPPEGCSGDCIEAPREQPDSVHTRRTVALDRFGNATESIDYGRVRLDGSGIDDPLQTTTQFTPRTPCNAAWQCQAQSATTGVTSSFDRKVRFSYDPATGDLTDVERFLEGSAPLLRRHEDATRRIAPVPPTASTPGWKNVAHFEYDAHGNAVEIRGAGDPRSCTTIGFDTVYGEFVSVVRAHKSDCASTWIETHHEFDRGFGRLVSVTEPSGAVSKAEFDAFGRPSQIFVPQADAPPGTLSLANRFTYHDADPVSFAKTETFTDAATVVESIGVANSLGEPVLAFQQADPASGDPAPWVLAGAIERDSAGRLSRNYRPLFFSAEQFARAIAGTEVALPPDATVVARDYDTFSRIVGVRENDTPLTQYMYFPLRVDSFDAEQLRTGGAHGGLHQSTQLDGRGQIIVTSTMMREPVGQRVITDTLSTTNTYLATGELIKVVQSHARGTDTVVRSTEYDSFGRPIRNIEPNTSTMVGGRVVGWTYAWDDAGRLVGTSDARGCGENFFYDGLNRLLAEDYSPCKVGQAAYTPVQPGTWSGAEASYRYDEYEPGQAVPEPGFLDLGVFAIGRVTATRDRGSHIRFNYDALGNLRRVARQVAKPGTGAAPVVATGYANHWFSVRDDLDLVGRISRQTTGVDVAELQGTGAASEIHYAYTLRGGVKAISSSYGTLLNDARFDPDGAIRKLVLGDAAATTATYEYDSRGRLSRYHLARAVAAVWTQQTPTYSLPDDTTTEQELTDLNFSYDQADNPTRLEDRVGRNVWPAGARSVTRTAEYDDLYRVRTAAYDYHGADRQHSPFEPEANSGNAAPVPLQHARNRIRNQTVQRDWKGNLRSAQDDQNLLYDRSLGTVVNGESAGKPNHIVSAGDGRLNAKYDEAGNLVDLTVERDGACAIGAQSKCAQRFIFDWDELGQLSRARRWDYAGTRIPAGEPRYPAVPSRKPTWDGAFAYTGGRRILTSMTAASGAVLHSMEIFDSLRLDNARYDPATNDYERTARTETVHLGGMARLVFDSALPSPAGKPLHVFFETSDTLGSADFVLDAQSGEVVERSAFQVFGAIETDFRPARWQAFRDDRKFTGKQEDIEFGIVYFGARYYHPRLQQWLSADPLSIHEAASDLNPYSYVSGKALAHIDPLGLQDPQDDTDDEGCVGGDEICGIRRDDPPGGGGSGRVTIPEVTIVGWPTPQPSRPDTGVDDGTTLPGAPSPEAATPAGDVALAPATRPYDRESTLSRWINTGTDPVAATLRSSSFDTYLRVNQYIAGTAAIVAGGFLVTRALGPSGVAGSSRIFGILMRAQALAADVNAGLTTGGVAVGGGAAGLVYTPLESRVNQLGAAAEQELGQWVFGHSISVVEASVEGRTVRIIGTQNQRIARWLSTKAVLMENEVVAPVMAGPSGRFAHSEIAAMVYAKLANAIPWRVASYPQGCLRCQQWIVRYAQSAWHQTPRAGGVMKP